MTDQLSLYNGALRECGERKLASLTEAREPRRILDDVWDSGGVDDCLEMGQWYFAMRTVQVDYDTDVTPDFGYIYAFSKPSDWKVTSALCSDEYFREPLLDYADEAGYWYTDYQTIYVRYVSNDSAYGKDYSLWPQAFVRYVEAYLASEICLKVTGDKERTKLVLALAEKRLKQAKNVAAMALPTQFPANGNWVRSRRGGRSRRDRGNRGSLIG